MSPVVTTQERPRRAALPLIAWVRTPSPGKTAETARDSKGGGRGQRRDRDRDPPPRRLRPSHENLLPPSAAAAQRKGRAGPGRGRPAPRAGPRPQRAPSQRTGPQEVGEGLFPKKYPVVAVDFGIL